MFVYVGYVLFGERPFQTNSIVEVRQGACAMHSHTQAQTYTWAGAQGAGACRDTCRSTERESESERAQKDENGITVQRERGIG